MDDTFNKGVAPHPIDSVIYLTEVFTPEECKEIIKIGTTHWKESKGSIGGDDKIVDDIRRVTIYAPESLSSSREEPNEFDIKWRGNFAKNDQSQIKYTNNKDPGHITVTSEEENAHRGFQDWLCERIMGFVREANTGNEYFPGWKFDIQGFLEMPMLMKYDEDQDGTYDWHIDIGPMPPYSRRKISYSIILNSKDEYDGGELYFKLEKDDLHREFYDVGGVCMFPTYLLHKILPVTRGARYVLVGWIHGDQPFR